MLVKAIARCLYSRAMSDRDDLEELARRYLDLWQNHITALAEDPEFAASMQRLMQATGMTAGAAWPAWARNFLQARLRPCISRENSETPYDGNRNDGGIRIPRP